MSNNIYFNIIKRVKQKSTILFIVPFFILLLYYFAFYPGCTSADSYAYLTELNDHHPLFFLIYIRAIKFIFFGFDGYILINIILYSLLLARLLVFFLKNGSDFRVLLVFSFVFSIVPSIGYMMVTYWKDVLYGISIFYFSYILIYYTKTIKENNNPNKYIFFELFIATLFIIGTRHNGIAVVLFSFFVLFFCFKKIRNKLVFILSIAVLVNYFFIFIAFQFGGAKKTWMSFDHVLVKHLSTFLHEKKLDEEGKKVLAKIMPIDSFETQFSYYSHDGYAFGNSGNEYRENVKSLKSEIRNAFFRNIKNNPTIFFKSEFMMTELIWSPIPIKGSFRNTYCSECGAGKFSYLNNLMKKLVSNSNRIDKPLYTRLIFWSGSFQVWILLLLFIFIAVTKGLYWTLPFLPLIGNVGSLFIALVSQDFRYLFSEVLMSFIMFSYLYNLYFIKVNKL